MTTVKELIEFLKSQPEDLRVLVENTESGYDDINLEDVSIKNVYIGAGEGRNFGGQHEQAYKNFAIVYNELTNVQEAYYKPLYEEWQRVRSFTDANILPSYGGEWAWSNGENRWVRLSPPEPGKPEPIPWPIEKALLLN
jgi:hypothetical protein